MQKTILALSLFLAFNLPASADMAKAAAALRNGDCPGAIKELTPAAEAGDVAAQSALGDLNSPRRSPCGKPGDPAKALAWYVRAAESGDSIAQTQVAELYSDGAKLEQAALWYRKAAEKGNVEALQRLGAMYEDGKGVARDRVLADLMNNLAVAQEERHGNDSFASHVASYAGQLSTDQLEESGILAAAWKPGQPLPTTSVTGRNPPSRWYLRKAADGDVDAAYRLGLIYSSGYEGNADQAQAALWMRRAAEKGHADAQLALSGMYAEGLGVSEDYVLAAMLNDLAAAGGNQKAKTKLREYWTVTLTPEQAAEARALGAGWTLGSALPGASVGGRLRKVAYAKEAKSKRPATPEVLALFHAAGEGDEAGFTRLLAGVGDINDYTVERRTLLQTLMLPAPGLTDTVERWRKAHNTTPPPALRQEWRALHLALMPAKTRMLDAALRRGASVREGSPDKHGAPLHWATVFGTPDMVRLLLRGGADPREYGGEKYTYAPLEFALDLQEHGLRLPEMPTVAQRTDMLEQLLAAGAERPFKADDDKRAPSATQSQPRPSADERLWDNLVRLTSGARILTALEALGTTPTVEPRQKTVLAYAAEAGNLEAVKWLKQRMPRGASGGFDNWADAAMRAMYNDRAGADELLRELLVADMPWAQLGPRADGRGGSYALAEGATTPPNTIGTLLDHAVLTHRPEWVKQLVAWGAPVNAKASDHTPLELAVRADDADMVGLLLDLGADPFAGDQTAFSTALRQERKNNAVLRLLLARLTPAQRTKLEASQNSPLRRAFPTFEPRADGELLKLLVDAGFSTDALSYADVEAVMASGDPTLFEHLRQHGWLTRKPEAKDAKLLISAIGDKPADLMPQLLQLGLDPNVRSAPDEPTPMEVAVAKGDMAAFAQFTRHNGRLDATATGPWGKVLDLAVSSLNPAMLRAVGGPAPRLKGVCLPDDFKLEYTVLRATDAYWATLRRGGFGAACPSPLERLMREMITSPGQPQAGWLGRRLAERLKDIGAAPARPGAALDEAIVAPLRAAGRDDLLQALRVTGWKIAAARKAAPTADDTQKSEPADLALAATLAGHYYLENVREVGSELTLAKDGRFSYSMTYGATDEYAAGQWRVVKRRVVFRSSTGAPAPGYVLRAPAAREKGAADADVSVETVIGGKPIPGVFVTLVGERPRQAKGRTDKDGWSAPLAGPLRQIVLYHPEINGGRAFVHEVVGGARHFSFEVGNPQAQGSAFNVAMTVRDGKLVSERNGTELVYGHGK